jgi:hypothetical protein
MSSVITTGEEQDYKTLYIKLKNLSSIIKKTAISSLYNKGVDNSDKVNIKKFFEAGFNTIFPSFEETTPDTSYDNGKQYVISGSTQTASDQNLAYHTVQNKICKNTLTNCINLKIDQTTADATGVTNSNSILTALSSGSKQHLLFYKKLTGSSEKNNTQNFDEKICKNIYYTIFLLDVYIKIVEALISSNIDGMGNEDIWNNNVIEITGDKTGNVKYDDAIHADYRMLLEHRDLVKTYGEAATFRNYNDIHILYNKLNDGDSENKAVGKWVTNNDDTKEPSRGIYLYLGDEFKDISTYKYFNNKDTLVANPVTSSILPQEVTNRNYTFIRNSNNLANFSKSQGNKYIYKEFSFSNEASGDFTDIKKPYQRYIRIFLIMIRNIKFHNLKQTLHYLLIYLKCLKSTLLTSIRSINIYFNLVWSLTNCLALNCPSYKDTYYNFIKYISSDTETLTPQIQYNSQLPSNYFKNSYVYGIKDKSATSTSDSFKTILNNIDNNIYNHIYNLNVSIPLTVTNLDKYGYNNDGLLYTKFSYDSSLRKISYHSMADSESIPITDTFIKLKNNRSFPDKYILIIPDKNIRALISSIEVNSIDERFIDMTISSATDLEGVNSEIGNLASLTNGDNNIPVYVIPKTTFDIEKNIFNLKNNINRIDENINSNKTKILNNTSLYESHKAKNKLLYDQLIAYLVIISFVTFILLIVNVANVKIAELKLISLMCFGVIVLLVSVYYIINTIYIDENYVETFVVVKNQDIFSDICRDCKNPNVGVADNSRENNDKYKIQKKNKVDNILKSNAILLSSYIDLALLYTDSQTLYNKEVEIESLEKNRHDAKNYANYVLEHKKDDAHLNIDVVKYENANYTVYLRSIILLALIIIGSYTINLYTNNNFFGIIALISVILLIVLFTYYIININRTVRTISSNYYWGREFPKSYEQFSNTVKK